MELAAGLLLDAFSFISDCALLKKSICVWRVKIPRARGSVTAGAEDAADLSMERSTS